MPIKQPIENGGALVKAEFSFDIFINIETLINDYIVFRN